MQYSGKKLKDKMPNFAIGYTLGNPGNLGNSE